jgi:hypothetical protein
VFEGDSNRELGRYAEDKTEQMTDFSAARISVSRRIREPFRTVSEGACSEVGRADKPKRSLIGGTHRASLPVYDTFVRQAKGKEA